MPTALKHFLRAYWEGLKGRLWAAVSVAILDIVSAGAAASVILVLVAALADTAESGGQGLLSSIMGMIPGRQFLDAAPNLVVYAAGLMSAGLILLSVTTRFVASRLARRLARDYHQSLIATVVRSVNEAVPGSNAGIRSGQDVNVAALQNSIHISKAFETMLRMPLSGIFSTVFLGLAFLTEPTPTMLLAVGLLLGGPIMLWVARRIDSGADEFFSRKSQEFAGLIASRVNRLDAYVGSYPCAPTDTGGETSGPLGQQYFDAFDTVQLATERMSFFTGVFRALGFGAGVSFVIFNVLSAETEFATVIAYATLIYLSVSHLQSLFGGIGSLMIFLPQIRRFYQVLDGLTMSVDRHSPDTERLVADSSRSDLESVGGQTVNLVVLEGVNRFTFGALIDRLNASVQVETSIASASLFRSFVYNFSHVRLNDLDARLKDIAGRSFEELCETLGAASDYQRWVEDVLRGDKDAALDEEVWRSASGTIQGCLILAFARVNDSRDYFLERTLLTRFHGEARKMARAFFGDARVWSFSALDDISPIYDEEMKLVVSDCAVERFPVGDRIAAKGASSATVPDIVVAVS